jgi:predicted nucleic acid-binding protein
VEPYIFSIELASQLSRRMPLSTARKLHRRIIGKIIIIDELYYNDLLEIAFKTGCRAIDAYYIATANLTNSPLVTADKLMAENAQKINTESYFVLESRQYNSLINKLSAI